MIMCLFFRTRSQTCHQLLKEPLRLIKLALCIHLSYCFHCECALFSNKLFYDDVLCQYAVTEY